MTSPQISSYPFPVHVLTSLFFISICLQNKHFNIFTQICLALSIQSVSQTNKLHNLAHVTSSDPDKSFAWPFLRSKFTNQRLSTFFNNGECLYLCEKMYNDCFYHRSGAFFCNYYQSKGVSNWSG